MGAENFEVRSTDQDGQPYRATEPGPSVEAIVERYRRVGRLQVSTVEGVRTLRLFQPGHVSREAFAAFNAELAAACRANLPLPGTLRALAADLAGRPFREAIEEIAHSIEEGRALPDALAARPDVFPPAYIALVRAGAAAGDLPGALLDVSVESRVAARALRTARVALVYPALLAIFGSVLLTSIATIALPIFETVFRDLGAELPVPTELLIASIPVLRNAPLLLLGLAVTVGTGWRIVARATPFAPPAARLALAVPFLGPFLRAAAVTRFTRVLAATLGRGVPVPDAITLAGLASGNAAVQAAADAMRREALEGEPISAGLLSHRVFPRRLAWFVSLAEGRGEVVDALREIARLEEEAMERAGAVLPVAIAILGVGAGALFVALVAWATLLPLVSLIDKLG